MFERAGPAAHLQFDRLGDHFTLTSSRQFRAADPVLLARSPDVSGRPTRNRVYRISKPRRLIFFLFRTTSRPRRERRASATCASARFYYYTAV